MTAEVLCYSIARKGDTQMSIAGDLIRGHTDAIILARLMMGDSYGYEINKIISTTVITMYINSPTTIEI